MQEPGACIVGGAGVTGERPYESSLGLFPVNDGTGLSGGGGP